ncbi:Fur family transcriptional regulator [Nonomuraea sp. NPDC050663]|uniref:Fur family transcriptional regulator n=1 Tax=Nonomuraea sp. NPDC050663 TaxID=3364370 RepID=UPI0017F99BEA|nr:transcriptional repressor [Thermoactinospora sp.]
MAETTWHEELRAKGYRVTPQRQLVLEAVKELEHATPEEICTKVRETARGVNISTVYRTLELLEELGMVTHTHLSHGAPTYHLASEANHVHLVCRSCGSVGEVPLSAADGLVKGLEETAGFAADARHLTVFGQCRECR